MKQVTVDKVTNGYTAKVVSSGKTYVFTSFYNFTEWLNKHLGYTSDINLEPKIEYDLGINQGQTAPSKAHVAPFGHSGLSTAHHQWDGC